MPGMPDLEWTGVRVVGALLIAGCVLQARGRLDRLPPHPRGVLLNRIGRLPVTSQYIRLARGLGLASYYERVAS